MPHVELDDDVYRYLCSQTQAIGESASSILRRLLGLVPETSEANHGKPIPPLVPANADLAIPSHRHSSGPAADTNKGVSLVPGLDLSGRRTAVARFLTILQWLHDRHSGEFGRVLEVGGHQRVYFGRTREAIEATGSSVDAQQVPDTDFWVVTNNSTPRKCKIVRDAVALFGYPKAFAEALGEAVDPASALVGIPIDALTPLPDHEPWKI